MALTDTDLQVVVEHVKRMLPAMLIETAPRSHLQGDASATAPGNYAEEHLARFEERTAQEFKALRELMQAGFAAVDKRFEDMNKRFEDMNKRFEDMNKRFEEMNANIDKRFAAVDKRFEDMNKRFEEMNANIDKRFAAVNKRFEDMNKRFTAIQWMGTVAFVVLGVIISVVGLS